MQTYNEFMANGITIPGNTTYTLKIPVTMTDHYLVVTDSENNSFDYIISDGDGLNFNLVFNVEET